MKLVERLSYKPNSHFIVRHDSSGDSVEVVVETKCDDATERSTTKVSVFMVATFNQDELLVFDERTAINRIRRAVIELEMHEVNEFLKLDGVHVVDPHPDE